MINNLSILQKILRFDNSEDFYFIQIFRRRKDNPGMSRDMIVIKNYYINSEDQLSKCIPEIIQICDANNARAYIRLNRRNFRKVALKAMTKIALLIEDGNYANVMSAYDHAAGIQCSEEPRWWFVDVDSKDEQYINKVKDVVTLVLAGGDYSKDIIVVPTKNGVHLICHPFDVQVFNGFYHTAFDSNTSSITVVHKDNPTILYTP